ncbi:hypothetical protein OQA88_3013 [Cercophora sp. LCS_1]
MAELVGKATIPSPIPRTLPMRRCEACQALFPPGGFLHAALTTDLLPVCRHQVCLLCLQRAIKHDLGRRFCLDLEMWSWFWCPVGHCASFLHVPLGPQSVDSLRVVLRGVGYAPVDIQQIVDSCRVACNHRDALKSLTPPPSQIDLYRMQSMHNFFAASGAVRPLHSVLGPINLGKITYALADYHGGKDPAFRHIVTSTERVQVPFFLNLVARGFCEICYKVEVLHLQKGEAGLALLMPPADGVYELSRVLPSLTHKCNGSRPALVCGPCTNSYVARELQSMMGPVTITCPEPDCEHKLSYQEVMAVTEEETGKRYDKLLAAQEAARIPNFRWCTRADCKNGQIFPDGCDGRVVCHECRYPMCFKHQTPWHANLSCDEYDQKEQTRDIDSKKWIELNTRLCPNKSCGVKIERTEGCPHMECAVCAHEFCWLCLADWDNEVDHDCEEYDDDPIVW